MKKIISKLKGKKVLSIVLAAVMFVTTFSIALPMLKIDASAATTIDGVTQERVVGTDGSYEATYEKYAAQYLNGASSPTNIVIPGLNAAQDYVIQGMTYYPKRDWMLVTAYHNYDSKNDAAQSSSKVFALDAATGDFVAMFSFINVDGTTANVDHGGGIAVSEHNIYYACGDQDRKIAYAPISYLENAPLNAHTQIPLVAEKDFVEVGSVSSSSKTAYTAYVCYDEGILWTGNFYDPGASLIGINIAATDYNAPANNTYNSMVFGYKLQGSTSEEEWANLVGAKGTDCQGNPSYAIGLSNAIKDVQYAVVDNGRLYLSRSFGSGAGNSVNFGFGETSLLTIADIDLSQPGTSSVTISTTSTGSLDKEIMVHDISNYKEYDMMPMSEGLCFIDDELFITFEGASNKYLKESSGLTAIGNCEKPVDVIWHLDPYELMDLEKTAQDKSTCYERVNSLNDIKDGEEYIILFESVKEDPVTQKNILYAFDSNGNFKGNKLSKGNMSEPIGYDGMIGHKITEYTIETDSGVEKLYLSNPEKDDTESVRWIINKTNGYSIKSTDTYFANYKNFYVSADEITMAPDNAPYLSDLNIAQLQGENGYFYISKGGQYFLWCNDGTDEQVMATVNEYYAKTAAYSGITEVAGTFHCNATASPILGGTVPEYKTEDYPGIRYPDGAFKIYRREVDSTSSAYESRVYSNMDTKLEADGTYTVTLDTYAISPNHYQYVGERPTDYIIVADTSQSTYITNTDDSNIGSTGVRGYGESDTLSVGSLTDESDTADDRGEGIVGYSLYNSSYDIRYLHTDGKYYKMYLAVNNVKMKTLNVAQYYFLYFIGDDGYYHCFSNQSATPNYTYTEAQFKEWVANPEQGNGYPYQTASSTENSNANRRKETLFTGPHYRFDNINSEYTGEHTSIDAVKTTAKNLVDDIVAQGNTQNRIALVQYGSSSSYLGTDGSWKTSGFGDAFLSATADSASTLNTQIDSLSATLQSDNSGIELDTANEIIDASGKNYTVDGDRNLAVIFLSDGVPGAETAKNADVKDGCEIIGTTYGVTIDENDANNAANSVIDKAHEIKNKGAFIYTVLFGKVSAGNFKKKVYMDAVSSKYPGATEMTKLGGQSVDGVTYALNIATASYDYFTNFGSIACKEVAVNNAVGLDNLNAGSYLREVLGDALIFPENEDDYSIETQLVPGEYDEIGRFGFGTPYTTTDITTDIDITTKTITVTGYDYSARYISRGNDGEALRVVIKGLLANDGKEDLSNEIVTVDGKTGIYKGKDEMKDDDAFRSFPTDRISIPEYTYVLDYGLDLLDVDVNGTMLALDEGLNAQPKDADGNILYRNETNGHLIEMADSNQNLVYKVTPTSIGDKGCVLIDRKDGTYDWFKLNVVPASNIYFEETEFDKTAGTGTVAWGETTGGTSVTHRDVPKALDVDGYDEAYNNENTYSNGKTLSATVNATNKISKTATVTFVGDGIDIISACGPTTGIQIINIKKDGKSVKAGIVDTYYSGGDFTQVPVFSWRGTHGTYTVESTAVYLSTAGALGAMQPATYANKSADAELVKNSSTAFDTSAVQQILDEAGFEDISAEDVELIWHDDNSILNGGTGALPVLKGTSELKMSAGDAATTKGVASGDGGLNNYLDGFRIYNPLGASSDDYTESEKNASYVNVINNLAPVGDGKDNLDGIGFITGTLGDGEKLTFSNYRSVGPKDEFYLLSNQTVTFNTNVNKGEKVMLGLRAVNGPTTVIITSNKTGNNVEITVNSATEMFYDISKCIGDITADNTVVQVIVQNTGAEGKMLAVNQVKFSGGTKVNTGNGGISSVNDPVFLSLTPAALTEVEISLTEKETVQGEVKNGVIVPDIEEIPEDNTNTDTDNTNPDNENTNDGTDTEGSEEDFDILSLIRMFIKMLETIIKTAFGAGNIA